MSIRCIRRLHGFNGFDIFQPSRLVRNECDYITPYYFQSNNIKKKPFIHPSLSLFPFLSLPLTLSSVSRRTSLEEPPSPSSAPRRCPAGSPRDEGGRQGDLSILTSPLHRCPNLFLGQVGLPRCRRDSPWRSSLLGEEDLPDTRKTSNTSVGLSLQAYVQL